VSRFYTDNCMYIRVVYMTLECSSAETNVQVEMCETAKLWFQICSVPVIRMHACIPVYHIYAYDV